MDREETKDIFKLISYVYPMFEVTSEKLDTWHYFLKDQSFDDVEKKTKKHIMSQKFPPTISEIITQKMIKKQEQIDHEQMLRENGLL